MARSNATPLLGRLFLLLLLVALGAGALALAGGHDAPRPRPTPLITPAEPVSAGPAAPLPRLSDGRAGSERSTSPRRRAARPAPRATTLAMAVAAERRVLVDVAGLRATAPGAMLMRCLRSKAGEEADDLRARSGFDPFEQIHTMGVVDGMAVAEGDFADVDWQKMRPAPLGDEPYGQDARLYLDENGRGVAVWQDRLLLGDARREGLIAAIDRLRGDAPAEDVPALRGTSGELPAADLFEVLPAMGEIRGPVEKFLHEHGVALRFSVDADDQAVRARVVVEGDREVLDSLAGALDSIRGGGVSPEARGKLGGLLSSIEVRRGGDALTVSASLTMGALEALLEGCGAEE